GLPRRVWAADHGLQSVPSLDGARSVAAPVCGARRADRGIFHCSLKLAVKQEASCPCEVLLVVPELLGASKALKALHGVCDCNSRQHSTCQVENLRILVLGNAVQP